MGDVVTNSNKASVESIEGAVKATGRKAELAGAETIHKLFGKQEDQIKAKALTLGISAAVGEYGK